MSRKPSLRVYFVTHHDGRRSGYLMRHREMFWDEAAPAAYGASEEDVLFQLARSLQRRLATKQEDLGRYLFTEQFHSRVARLDVHPASVVDKQPVIGKREIPLRLGYAHAALAEGGFRIMLPRFGWWIIVEDLSLASDALRTAVGGALLGKNPRWMYEFRHEGAEYVVEWSPDEILRSRKASGPPDESDTSTLFPTLHQVAENWVERAKIGRLPKPIGDDPTFESHSALLFERPRPSILLVGPPGVGKTTFVQRAARALRQREIDFKNESAARLWATSADRIVAGMLYVGMWQERCLKLVEELADEGDFLYVDRMSEFLKERSAGSSIAELFAPAVSSGAVSLIAECTPAELTHARRTAASFLEDFELVHLPEMPVDRVRHLIVDYGRRQRSGHTLHRDSVGRLTHHLAAFRRDQCFPGKALQFMDWLANDRGAPSTLYPADLSAAYARYSGLPVELIADEHSAGSEQVAAELRKGVVGQDEACAACARVIAPFKAGMQDPDKPIGSLFFVGPTGVGKTELAKQLCRYLFGDANRLVRLDMSEYMNRGAAQRMLRVGRGVTSLAQQVRDQPLSVVLFDEIEKAHRETFDMLLGLLGEGRLTDETGRLVDFRMTVIVLTSNLGVSDRRDVGFGSGLPDDFERSVRAHFRPEFFNRLDHVVSFRHLAPQDVRNIVDLEVRKLRQRPGFASRGIRLVVTDDARARLAELGYDARRGARPLQRVIEEKVVTPIAVRLAEQPALRDLTVRVHCAGERVDAGELGVVVA